MSEILTSQHYIWVWVDGVNFGTHVWWDTCTGGEVDSDEVKYRPTNIAWPNVSLGGAQEVGNVTVSRLYQIGRDDWFHIPLMNRCGRAQMQVVKSTSDRDGNEWGFPLIYLGILKACTPPEADSNAAADAAMIELEMSSARVYSR